tara:strand:+ start:270 stop:959 length:690 start_codon:yes stop_codon:yes gene_type:complete
MKSFADFISEATPRGKAIQRGKISKADAQKRQAREDRRAAAQERRDDKAKAGIDALIGSQADRRYAKQRRDEENKKRQERNKKRQEKNLDKLVDKAARKLGINLPDERQKALKRTIADRMAKGAKEHGLDEERRETEIGITGQPVPNKKLGAKKRYEFEKKRRENLKKMPGDAPGESKLIQLMRDRAKKEENFSESRTKEQQIKGQKAVLDAKIKSEYDKITKEIPRRK